MRQLFPLLVAAVASGCFYEVRQLVAKGSDVSVSSDAAAPGGADAAQRVDSPGAAGDAASGGVADAGDSNVATGDPIEVTGDTAAAGGDAAPPGTDAAPGGADSLVAGADMSFGGGDMLPLMDPSGCTPGEGTTNNEGACIPTTCPDSGSGLCADAMSVGTIHPGQSGSLSGAMCAGDTDWVRFDKGPGYFVDVTVSATCGTLYLAILDCASGERVPCYAFVDPGYEWMFTLGPAQSGTFWLRITGESLNPPFAAGWYADVVAR